MLSPAGGKILRDFPYGKAPFWILVVALVTGYFVLAANVKRKTERPDIVFATFAANHLDAYTGPVREFEKKHNVRVQIQLVSQRSLRSRLQAALLTGADVPDMVELLAGQLSVFTRGPLEDVGFVDLTGLLWRDSLYDALVQSRFEVWKRYGRIMALPHDIHPVMLGYRRDIVEELGIDVDSLTTWDAFCAAGRRITGDVDGDGIPDRYMIDLPRNGAQLPLLLHQRGIDLFDAEGNLTMESDAVVNTVVWYVKQVAGPQRIAYEAGWGQSLAKCMLDGLVLFYFCPDWRAHQFELDVPSLKGKMGLMPLPAWEPGGRRTSSWGGTGLVITKACKKPELAWELAKALYFDKEELGERFAKTCIIPPMKEAWDLPQFRQRSEFYSGQTVGTLYAELAPDVPGFYDSPYGENAEGKLFEGFMNALDYYERNGEQGLTEYARKEVGRCAAYVRKLMNRNRFLNKGN